MTELEALRAPGTADFGAEALIVCDQLVRIYSTEDIEVQALQALDNYSLRPA